MRDKTAFLVVVMMITGVMFAVRVIATSHCSAEDLFVKAIDNNSHAGTCSGSDYSVPVKWGFGSLTGTGRACKADRSNVIAILSSVNNAHAARPDLPPPGGNIDVCFGNLSCGTDTSVYGTKCLYSLKSVNNSQVGACDYYPINVHCNDTGSSPGIPPPVGLCPDPDARIIAPPSEATCNVIGSSDIVNFSQQQAENFLCFDYSWDIGNGVTFTTWNADYQYPTPGQKHIALTVKSKDGTKISQDSVDVLIVDSSASGTEFVCAIISHPHENNLFNTSDYILFNGSKSFAVNVVGGDVLQCLAGDCPECIINGDGTGSAGCTGTNKIVGHGNPLDDNSAWRDLNFFWNFGDGIINKSNGILGILLFKVYANPGPYTTQLTVIRENNFLINSSANVTFNLQRKPGCSSDYRVFVDTAGIPYFTDLPSFNLCGGLDRDISTSSDNCCPQGWECRLAGNCDNSTAPADSCIDICKNLLAEAAGNTYPNCIIPHEGFTCGRSAAGKCELNATCKPPVITPGVSPDSTGTCTKTYDQSACTNQLYTLSWTSSFSGNPELGKAIGCIDGSRQFPCGRIAKLAFFTLKNVISVLLLVIVFYLIINRKKISKKIGRQ